MVTSAANLDRYWSIVRACFTEIYDVQDRATLDALHRLAASLQETHGYRDILYHSEPLNVAADMIGHYGRLSDNKMRRYDQLVERIDNQAKSKTTTREETAKTFASKPTVPEKALAAR